MTDDAAARERIATDTAATLFVNAGAGSGKTTALVTRVCTLVLDHAVAMRQIAAVTFTEKAGAELRDRLRAEFETTWRESPTSERGQRAAEALDDLDRAAVGTLHSFARRILTEHAIAAGLPPLLDVLDDVGSSVAFDERWAALQTALLDDDAMETPVLLGLSAGLKLTHVRSLARALGADWDLIGERVLTTPAEPVTIPDIASLLAQAQDVLDLTRYCTDDEDKLLAKFPALQAVIDSLSESVDDGARVIALQQLSKLKFTLGRKGSWQCDIADVRAAGKALTDAAEQIVVQVLDQCLRSITRWTAERVLAAAEQRRRDGQLEFHDLLVLARDLLRRDASVREELHHAYQRLLLDEFQDTDPIQIELAVRIAGGAAASQDNWSEIEMPAGRLFFVGDAKQSIYKFRRANISTYLHAQTHLGEQLSLTTNFRSVKPVLDWVNAVFSTVITETPGSQPAYEALAHHRPDRGRGSAVTVLGADPHTGLPRAAADILRSREAADVAAVINQMLAEQWQVQDERTKAWRTVRLSDIAVLIPARTSLSQLEDALDTTGIPYRAEASSLVYESAEIRDLMACARAVVDPTDELSLLTALRSPLFGCGDDDLWSWKHAGGHFSLWAPPPASSDIAVSAGPVATAVEAMGSIARGSRWLSPSELLARIIEDRRMFEVAAGGPRRRDTWRRLRFVVDQARAWSQVSRGGLRAYLAWAAHQGQESSRVTESVLPETDVDAVRVTTLHAAKGLEFPVVIMSGLSAQPRTQRGVRLLWPSSGGYEVKLGAGLQTGDFDAVVPIDEQMDATERLRLLYVAATRARDHLIVSLHRAAGSTTATAAYVLANADAAAPGLTELFTAANPDIVRTIPQPSGDHPPAAAYEDWIRRIQTAQTSAARDAAIVASGLEGTEPSVVLASDQETPGAHKGPRDLSLPPWSKGRYGSAIGRAVHGVLQSIDLTTGDDLELTVAAQCIVEGLTDQAELVTSLVRSALDNELVQKAAARQNWRESYVGTVREDGILVEGYVDLIFRDDDDTLVIIDYKTDAIPAGAVDSRVTYYQPQMQAYATSVQRATGSDVRVALLFLHPEGSLIRPVQLTVNADDR
jgi:ATP-dependent helicase/nuclease subunit A